MEFVLLVLYCVDVVGLEFHVEGETVLGLYHLVGVYADVWGEVEVKGELALDPVLEEEWQVLDFLAYDLLLFFFLLKLLLLSALLVFHHFLTVFLSIFLKHPIFPHSYCFQPLIFFHQPIQCPPCIFNQLIININAIDLFREAPHGYFNIKKPLITPNIQHILIQKILRVDKFQSLVVIAGL